MDAREDTQLNRIIRYLKSKSIMYYVKWIIWISLYYLFIQIEFGVIYFLLTCFYLIFSNLSSDSPQKEKKPSAYSVFNKGVSIPGTFSTESLEKSFNIPKYTQ